MSNLASSADPIPDSSVGTVFVDLSDLLIYLGHHGTVSGIQRVVVEVLAGLLKRHTCAFVVFSPERREFVRLDSEPVLALLRIVQHATEADWDRIESAVRDFQEPVKTNEGVIGNPGDVFAALGASWVHEGFFKAVMELRQQQVAVVVLLYDLIPVVFPGMPTSVSTPFRQFLPRVAFLADRAPAISSATRQDFERYCASQGWEAPPGGVTLLAADQWGDSGGGRRILAERAWTRPFALFVATVEVRKNHVLALRAWRRLIAAHGADAVPDLVCVGRLGWNCFDFLEEFAATNGLQGKISLLSNISDQRLAALYRDCEFTVYPSRYEGWGLPVTESLMAGKPCITAQNSSLPEAGGDFATYFPDNDLDGLVAAVERMLQPGVIESDSARIREGYRPPSWDDIAEVLSREVRAAAQSRRSFRPRLKLGTEYGLGPIRPYDGDRHGGPYMAYIDANRRLPLTGQVQDPMRVLIGDLMVQGAAEPSDPEGRPLRRGATLRLAFPRPAAGPLHLVAAFGSETPGGVAVRITGPLGQQEVRLPSGGACCVPLGPGRAEDPVELTIESRSDSTVVLASCCVLDSELEANTLLERRLGWAVANQATPSQAQLQYMRSSFSWRITRPLRRGRDLAANSRRRRSGG